MLIVSIPSFDGGNPDHSDPGRSDTRLHEDVGSRPGTLSSSRVSFGPYQAPPEDSLQAQCKTAVSEFNDDPYVPPYRAPPAPTRCRKHGEVVALQG